MRLSRAEVGGLMVDDVRRLRPRGHGESTGFAITLHPRRIVDDKILDILNVGTAIWFFVSLRIKRSANIHHARLERSTL
jgi:hypothetical protein